MSPGDEWIEIQEAAAIISKNTGREITPDYVRLMSHKGRIARKPKDRRQNLYLRSDVENIVVKRKDQRSQEKQRQDGGSDEAA